MRDGESRAVMKDVAYADARCVWEEPQGWARAATHQV